MSFNLGTFRVMVNNYVKVKAPDKELQSLGMGLVQMAELIEKMEKDIKRLKSGLEAVKYEASRNK